MIRDLFRHRLLFQLVAPRMRQRDDKTKEPEASRERKREVRQCFIRLCLDHPIQCYTLHVGSWDRTTGRAPSWREETTAWQYRKVHGFALEEGVLVYHGG